VLLRRIATQVARIALVEDDDAFLLTSERRIEELTREEPARVRKHHEGDAKLAPLRLVYGQRVREVERRRAFVAELPDPEVIVMTGLRSELDLEDREELLLSLALVVADYQPHVAVGHV